MKKYLVIIFFLFLTFTVCAYEKSKNNKNTKLNEKASKECQLIEEYIPVEKGNIQSIAGTDLEIGSVKLRPEGCMWNHEKGWYKP